MWLTCFALFAFERLFKFAGFGSAVEHVDVDVDSCAVGTPDVFRPGKTLDVELTAAA